MNKAGTVIAFGHEMKALKAASKSSILQPFNVFIHFYYMQ